MQKKVLFITNSYPAPDYRRLWKKATSLERDGWEVSVICPAGKRKAAKRKIKGVKIHFYSKTGSGNGSVFSFFWREAADLMKISWKVFWLFVFGRFRVIHIVNPSDTPGLIGAFYRFLGARLVYEINESYSGRYRLERIKIKKIDRRVIGILERLEKLALWAADLVIVPDFKQKARVARLIRETKNKIITIEPLPDMKDFYRPFLSRDYKRGFRHMTLYAGSLKIERGVIKLIRAVDFIVNKIGRKDILFVLAGTGRDEEKIKEYAFRKGISRYLYFPGWLSQASLLAYMTEADMGVSPEPARKGTGVLRDSVFEYLAVGKPVVSFDIKMSQSRIGKAGSFISDSSEITFAREIIRILDNKKRSRAMGEMGKIKVERDLNWLKSEIKLLSAYEKLAVPGTGLGEKGLAGKAA
ncbi:MAG: glycosyltransferase [Patescibacteria group bacterium]|nr:glycosyltransferase [Patescibacteria group bacterium]